MLVEYETAQVLVLNAILANNDNFFYDSLKEEYFTGKYREIYKSISEIILTNKSCSLIELYPRISSIGLEELFGFHLIPATQEEYIRAKITQSSL